MSCHSYKQLLEKNHGYPKREYQTAAALFKHRYPDYKFEKYDDIKKNKKLAQQVESVAESFRIKNENFKKEVSAWRAAYPALAANLDEKESVKRVKVGAPVSVIEGSMDKLLSETTGQDIEVLRTIYTGFCVKSGEIERKMQSWEKTIEDAQNYMKQLSQAQNCLRIEIDRIAKKMLEQNESRNGH